MTILNKLMIIRTDCSSQSGNGHLMRCLALAQSWKALGGRVIMIGFFENDQMIPRLQREGIDVVTISEVYPSPKDLDALVDLIDRQEKGASPGFTQPKPTCIVLDGYHFPASYQKALREKGLPLAVLDDMAQLPEYSAAVIVNQNIESKADDYIGGSDTVYMLGPRYRLIRNEFFGKKSDRSAGGGPAGNILVTMGGADKKNATRCVAHALSRLPQCDFSVKFVLGSNYLFLAELEQTLKQVPYPYRILSNIERMSEEMKWADLAIAAGGGTVWELAFMGVPMILIPVADNQNENVHALCEKGVAESPGPIDSLNLDSLADMIASLRQNQERRCRMSARAQKLVDGRGAQRICKVLNAISSNRFQDDTRIRSADIDDALQLFGLANDAEVRLNSFSPEPILWEDHQRWFNQKLASSDTEIWVADVEGVITAVVRYDRDASGFAEIDIAVHAGFRHKGLGVEILKLTRKTARNRLAVDRFRAVVKNNNPASRKCFIGAGFDAIDQQTFKGHPCTVFELNMETI